MNKSLLFSIIWTFPLEYIGQYWINRSHPMCNLPMCSSVPHVRHFFRNLCFASYLFFTTLKFIRKNFNSEITKMMFFKMKKLTSKALFYHLYHSIVFHHKLTFVFQNWQKSLFLIKNFISMFRALLPMWNIFWRVYVLHIGYNWCMISRIAYYDRYII